MADPNGWKEAAIAWEYCASLHEKYAKGKDPLFTTRQRDFANRANRARASLDAAAPAGGTAPPPASDGEVEEVLNDLRQAIEGAAAMGWDHDVAVITRAADLLERQQPRPVAVSERPWEREGWCDANGECWIGFPRHDETTESVCDQPPMWVLEQPHPNYGVALLPATALPLPEAAP